VKEIPIRERKKWIPIRGAESTEERVEVSEVMKGRR
jgi:hypothetical protein